MKTTENPRQDSQDGAHVPKHVVVDSNPICWKSVVMINSTTSEEFYLLGYSSVLYAESQPTFRRNMIYTS
jgi:hypothetical protein